MAMDKKYLDALQNLASAMDALVESLRVQEEKGKEARGGDVSDLNVTMVSIAEGIEAIKEQNEEILSQGETILKAVKSKKDNDKSSGFLGGLTGEGTSMKDGVKTIVLMAGAVLAMGLAFKIIGSVDFVSVMALAFALPLIALAFSQINEMGINSSQAVTLFEITTILSLAIMTSSWILSLVVPVSPMQLLTVIAISVMFAIVGYGLKGIAKSVEKITAKDLLLIPLVLIGISAAIMVSSFLLSEIKLVPLPQLLTAIAISAAFAVIGYGLQGISKAVQGMKMWDLFFIPLVLVGISAAIWASSYILQDVQPITLPTLVNIGMIALALAGISIIMSIAMLVISKLIKPMQAFQAGISVLIIAATIMASSHILALGDYGSVPSIDWTIGAVAGILGMSIPIIALGLLSMTGVGLVAIGMGAGATLIVAGTIMASSHILKMGDYSTFPSLEWAKSVSLLLTVFGAGMGALGAVILASFGLGLAALTAGAGAVLIVAQTIVDSSHILSKGNYSGGPTKEWAEGIGLAIGAFAPVFSEINKSKIFSLFGGDPMTGKSFGDIMVGIGESIVKVAQVLDGADTKWKQGPTEEWAKGIGIAIGAFAPVFSEINKSKVMSIFGGDPMTGDTYGAVMVTIAESIIKVAKTLDGSDVDWANISGPTETWAGGISAAIGAFAPIFESMGGIFGSDPDELGGAMITTIWYMNKAAMILSASSGDDLYNPEKAPKLGWARSTGDTLKYWSGFLTELDDESDIDDIEDGAAIANKIALSIGTISNSLGGDVNDNLIKSIDNIKNLASGFSILAKSITQLSSSLGSLEDIDLGMGSDLIITGKYVNEGDIDDMIINKTQTISEVTENITAPSSGDKEETGRTLDDIYTQMENMNSQLGVIAGNSTNLSDYIDELRTQTDDVNIKH